VLISIAMSTVHNDWRCSLRHIPVVHGMPQRQMQQRTQASTAFHGADMGNLLTGKWTAEDAVSDVEAMKRAIFSGLGPIKGNGFVPIGPWLDRNRPHDRKCFRKAA